jgi:hypothetical protein
MSAHGTPTPVTVIGGYLGAGKTTLINACLQSRGERKIAVLVNDFGDISIDAALIESQTDTVISLAGGCVCCSIGSDFMEALFGLAARPQAFDHILLETSGIALPRPLVQSIELCQSFTVQSVLVLADAHQLQSQLDDPYIGDTVHQQLKESSWILLTKASQEAQIMGVTTSLRKLGLDQELLPLAREAYSCAWLLAASGSHLWSARRNSAFGPVPDRAISLAPADLARQDSGYTRLRTLGLAGADGAAFDSLSIELDVELDLDVLLQGLENLAAGPIVLLQMVGQTITVEPFRPSQPLGPKTGSESFALVLIGIKQEMASRQDDIASFVNSLEEDPIRNAGPRTD